MWIGHYFWIKCFQFLIRYWDRVWRKIDCFCMIWKLLKIMVESEIRSCKYFIWFIFYSILFSCSILFVICYFYHILLLLLLYIIYYILFILLLLFYFAFLIYFLYNNLVDMFNDLIFNLFILRLFLFFCYFYFLFVHFVLRYPSLCIFSVFLLFISL